MQFNTKPAFRKTQVFNVFFTSRSRRFKASALQPSFRSASRYPYGEPSLQVAQAYAY